MIERLIQHVLTESFARLAENPGMVRAIFQRQSVPLADDEIEKIVKVYQTYKLRVKQNFTPDDASFPLIAIILGGQTPKHFLLGDAPQELSMEESAAFGQRGLAFATEVRMFESSSFRLQIAAVGNPDVTLYYYYGAKAILFAARPLFERNNVHISEIRGFDIPPIQKDKLPEWIWVRELSFVCTSEYRTIREIADGFPIPQYPVLSGMVDDPTFVTEEVKLE